MTIRLDYSRLATPPGDGDILIEPPARQWSALIDENVACRDRQPISLAGRDVRTVRQELRGAMNAAHADLPVVVCGHQPGFAHPGVWAKHVFARRVSARLGIRPLDLAVDNDAPTQPDLIVPIPAGGLVSTRTIPFSSAPPGCAYEKRPMLQPDQVRIIRREVAAATGDLFNHSLLPAYLDAYPFEGSLDFVDQHVAARAAIDQQFDAVLDEYRVSRFFDGPFVADLLMKAESFADAYNLALHDYRQREQVRGPHRPLPDLGREHNRIETALWIYKPLERRRRLWIEKRADRIQLFADTALVAEVHEKDLYENPAKTLVSLTPWLVRPRALTLTLWARLLVCDLFIHGIGGAKYDRITDDIFRRYYRRDPPGIACVSATLPLPLPRYPVTLDDLRRARRELRDVVFNPQRYLSAKPADLLEQRDRLLFETNELRRRHADRSDRRHIYLAIREINRRLLDHDPNLVAQLVRRAEQISAELSSNRTAASREFFYALQPPSRLYMLAERLTSACSET